MAGDADRRVARSKAAIMATTVELLAERGVAATTIDAISQRSGVAKTTIYRHWPSKPEVVVDAIGSVLDAPVDPDTGDLSGDLCALLAGLAEGLADDQLQRLLSSLMEAAAHDAELADLHRRHVAGRHDVVRQALRRGIDLNVNMLGRWAVWPTMSALALALVWDSWVPEALLYVGLAMTLAATAIYLQDGLRAMAKGSTST